MEIKPLVSAYLKMRHSNVIPPMMNRRNVPFTITITMQVETKQTIFSDITGLKEAWICEF